MATKYDVGHTSSVLCVDTFDGTGASGDEDGMMFLWDRSGQKKDAIKIGADGINSVKFSKTKPEIFASCGTEIHQFDLRYLPNCLFVFDFNQDEVNQIDLNPKEEFLAAADDACHVRVINIKERKVFKTLRKHENICSTVSFRPNQTSELISGAFDCGIIRWDFQRGKCIKQFLMNEMFQDDNEGVTSYVVNPPFVHSSSITSDGGFLSCGLENGTVHVFNASKKAVTHSRTFRGHSKGVSQVHFVAGNSKHLVSGGNDGHFIVWDVTKPDTNINKIKTDEVVESACLKDFDHGEKIHWLSSWEGCDDTFLLADQSNLIYSYQIL